MVVAGSSSSIIALPRNGALLIGRGEEADVRLATESASRKHARISVVEGEIEVTDLGSHNGTRLNGQPLEGGRALRSGDSLAIGDTTMVLHVELVSGPRALADAPALRGRLAGEVERALGFERPLTVIALALGEGKVDRGAAARAIEERLRPFDVAGWLADGFLAVLAPELDGEAADGLALRLLEALAPTCPEARAGIAECPTDGCDADALLEAARSASGSAVIGETARATGSAHRLLLGERSILIADPAMVRLYELVRRLAASNLSVVVTGETGAGKENAAFAVHHYSPRRDRPFVTLNCAALPEPLIESELFGHEKGAFTGAIATKVGLLESAHGGTVFLDEIGELQPAVQAKLLRAVEARRVTRVGSLKEHEIDIRIVAATHRDLEADVVAGRFRQDLLFRIAQATVVLPPLRDRPREIALLARSFLEAACAAASRTPIHLSAGALHKLARYGWPGNVRELKNVMEVAAATVEEDTLDPWHLPERITGSRAPDPPVAAPAQAKTAPEAEIARTFIPLTDEIRDLERRRMSEALTATRGNRTHAAELIKVPLRTFLLRIKQYGLAEVGRED
ncbi:MAG: FHA domain-containing protein [Myxococcales bacterium]|nr:FHA domain-containing protein [Myxococcales bacterium]